MQFINIIYELLLLHAYKLLTNIFTQYVYKLQLQYNILYPFLLIINTHKSQLYFCHFELLEILKIFLDFNNPLNNV